MEIRVPLWISRPSSFIPDVKPEEEAVAVEPQYRRLFDVFAHSEAIDHELTLPRAQNMESETMIESAARPLLDMTAGRNPPNLLIDCRSSAAIGGPAPTYRLAAKLGLNKALPFSLGGQGGTEVAQALTFLQHMNQNQVTSAILTAVQHIFPPDCRASEISLPKADGSTAILISSHPDPIIHRLCVLGSVVGQSCGSWEKAIEILLARITRRVGIARESITWAVVPQHSSVFEQAVRQLLPFATLLMRDTYRECHFGCADVLISLERFWASSGFSPQGIGAVVLAGQFGGVGVILIDTPNTPL